jgi:lysophospholipase L1-like esterase
VLDRYRRVLVLGIVIGLAVLTGTANAGRRVTGTRVLVIGDSLLNLSRGAVSGALAADGWDAVIDGRPGLSIEAWEPLVGADAAIARPNVAVVELGTNDCDTTCSDLGPAIDDVMEQLLNHGAGAVLWLNTQTTPTQIHPGPPRIYPAHADYVNYAIEQAAVRWPQMQVVNLRDLLDPHPEWHLADGLHPNPIGQQAIGALIRVALHRWVPATRAFSETEYSGVGSSSRVGSREIAMRHQTAQGP